MRLFTIHDSAAALYQRPFSARTEAEATRAFAGLAQDREHPVGQSPEDYALYLVAEFSEDTGVVVGLPGPKHVANAIAFVGGEA